LIHAQFLLAYQGGEELLSDFYATRVLLSDHIGFVLQSGIAAENLLLTCRRDFSIWLLKQSRSDGEASCCSVSACNGQWGFAS
jgi:hypothetical protein